MVKVVNKEEDKENTENRKKKQNKQNNRSKKEAEIKPRKKIINNKQITLHQDIIEY